MPYQFNPDSFGFVVTDVARLLRAERRGVMVIVGHGVGLGVVSLAVPASADAKPKPWTRPKRPAEAPRTRAGASPRSSSPPVQAAKILTAAAEQIKPSVMELGGKSASLVFPDCDLDAAAERARFLGRIDGRGGVAAAAGPVGVEKSSPCLVHPLILVRAKEVPLRLQQVGREIRAAVAVVIGPVSYTHLTLPTSDLV